MEKKEMIAKLEEEIFEWDEGTLELSTVLEEVEEWDSLSKLSLMALAKKDYGKKLTAEQVRGFVTVEDICNALQ